MKKPLIALALVLGLVFSSEAFAGGFVITPVGGFVRGPNGWVGWSPLGIAGRRNPVCMPAGGYQSMSFSQAPMSFSQAPVTFSQAPVTFSQAPVTFSQAPVSFGYAPQMRMVLASDDTSSFGASGVGVGIRDLADLLDKILPYVQKRDSNDGVDDSDLAKLEKQVESLKAQVGQLETDLGVHILEGHNNNSPDPEDDLGPFGKPKPDGAKLTPEQVNMMARQLLTQMKTRQEVAEKRQSIQAETAQVRILDQLRAEAANLK